MAKQIFAGFPSKLETIEKIRNRLRAQQRGAPRTESLESFSEVTAVTDRVSDADRFLLKKAFRAAASLAHPDKGGSNEDFQAVLAAYKAGDLKSLTEFFLQHSKTLNEQIGYWQTEMAKPHVTWKEFQSQTEFRIAQLHSLGRKPEALVLAEVFLDEAINILQTQELLSIKGNHGNY